MCARRAPRAPPGNPQQPLLGGQSSEIACCFAADRPRNDPVTLPERLRLGPFGVSCPRSSPERTETHRLSRRLTDCVVCTRHEGIARREYDRERRVSRDRSRVSSADDSASRRDCGIRTGTRRARGRAPARQPECNGKFQAPLPVPCPSCPGESSSQPFVPRGEIGSLRREL